MGVQRPPAPLPQASPLDGDMLGGSPGSHWAGLGPNIFSKSLQFLNLLCLIPVTGTLSEFGGDRLKSGRVTVADAPAGNYERQAPGCSPRGRRVQMVWPDSVPPPLSHLDSLFCGSERHRNVKRSSEREQGRQASRRDLCGPTSTRPGQVGGLSPAMPRGGLSHLPELSSAGQVTGQGICGAARLPAPHPVIGWCLRPWGAFLG